MSALFHCVLRSLMLIPVTVLLCAVASAADRPIDLALAHQYFAEADSLCSRDSGRLWGKSLCVPLAFVDPTTRMVVANRLDSAGKFSKEGEVYVGVWPENLPVANSTVALDGQKWTTVMWPPPTDRKLRGALMMHESFHYIQQELGFPAIVPKNAHLDTRDGRLWLRMEWHALRAALESRGADRRAAIQDALLFRAYRRSLFEQAAAEEKRLELHEGLAEYTGIRLSGMTDSESVRHLAETLESHEQVPSLVADFAYWSGPAYGLLLDSAKPNWRRTLTARDDLGAVLQEADSVVLPNNPAQAPEERMGRYDGVRVRAAEIERENEHNRILAGLRKRFVQGPLLVIPLQQMSIQYDPRNLTPLDNLGTVYPNLKISDLWGTLTVTAGALLGSDWTNVRVPAPADTSARPIEGDGWQLELNAGWVVAPSGRPGDYTLQSSK